VRGRKKMCIERVKRVANTYFLERRRGKGRHAGTGVTETEFTKGVEQEIGRQMKDGNRDL